jgi:hypothetical protein
MHTTVKILAPLSLAATILPAVLCAFKAIDDGTMKLAMLAATVVWFALAPFWLKGGKE